MGQTKICLYGGTDINKSDTRLIEALVFALLDVEDVILVSGGYRHATDDPDKKRMSVDSAVLQAVDKYCNKSEDFKKARFQTWLPVIKRPGVERFKEGTIRQISGSPRNRRFRIVRDVDAILTISGHIQTELVIELALALEKPILPIPFTGGDSKKIYKKKIEPSIYTYFQLSEKEINLLNQRPKTKNQLNTFASLFVEKLLKYAERRCLVLMPFKKQRGKGDPLKEKLAPAIEKAGFVPYHIGINEHAGNILQLFKDGLKGSHAILIDITGYNPNVMYELGYVHADIEEPPIIVSRDNIVPEDLLFYVRLNQVILYKDQKTFNEKIREALWNFRKK